MKPLRMAVGVVGFCCGIASLSPATALNVQRVADSSRRVEVPGVSVLIPGDGWASFPLTREEIALAQRTSGQTYSPDGVIRLMKSISGVLPSRPEDVRLLSAATLTLERLAQTSPTPEELVAEFKGELQPGQNITGKQRLIALDATPDLSLGATCVKYHKTTEMAGGLAVVGPRRFPEAMFVLDATGFFCVHPRWPQYIIDVHFDQLYAQGGRPLPLNEESATFLQSVVFTTTRPVAAASNIGDAIRAQMQRGVQAFDRREWVEAQTAFEKALLAARMLGDSPVPAAPLYYLASIARENGQPNAESLYREALELFEKYPEFQQDADALFGATLNDLGIIYARQQQFDRAEPLLLRGLETREKTLGANHRDVSRSLASLATLYGQWNRWPEAETFARRVLPLVERDYGPDDPVTRDIVLNLAYACLLQGKVVDGRSFMTRFLSIAKATNDPELPNDLKRFAEILRTLGLNAEAAELERTPVNIPR